MGSLWAASAAALALEGYGDDGQDDDALVWLADQWWTPWVMFVVCTVIGLWMVRSLVHHRDRGSRIRRAANAAGMSYREQDGFGLSAIEFHHMVRGQGRGWTASDVVTLEARDGAKVHAFDVRSWTEYRVTENENGERTMRRNRRGEGRVTDTLVRRYQGATQSAAVAPLPINAPRLVIVRENLASKLFTAATRLDVNVESEAFNRSYHVIGADRDFAHEVLDARMIDLMVSTEGRITFEFFGTHLLLHTEQLDPRLLPGLARLADEMRRVVPRLVVDRWPRTGRTSVRPGP